MSVSGQIFFIYVNQNNAETDMKIQLFSFKRDTKEIYKKHKIKLCFSLIILVSKNIVTF